MSENIQILDMQDGWLAVDKPSGLSVHNDPGKDLVSVLPGMIGLKSPSFFVRPVHRLDQETSGVILLATEEKALQALSGLFAAGKVKKEYLALVHGNFEAAGGILKCGTWEFPLSKEAAGRNDPAGKKPHVNCCTHYRVVQQSAHYSLLEIQLLSGRKHQIRRHAKLSGHPVTGDTRYGSKRSVEYLKKNFSFTRLGLHCRQLEFIPPGKSQPVCIVSKNPLTAIRQLLAEDDQI